MQATTTPKRDRDSEAGGISVEFAIVALVVITIVTAMIAFALRSHSKQIVNAAAEDALAVAQRHGSTVSQAQQAAQHDITVLSNGDLSNVEISVTYSGSVATVAVSADAPKLFSLIPVHVSSTVSAPVEQFVPPSGATP